MRGPASSTTAEIYMQAHEQTAIFMTLQAPKVWEQFADDIYSIQKHGLGKLPSHQQSSSKY